MVLQGFYSCKKAVSSANIAVSACAKGLQTVQTEHKKAKFVIKVSETTSRKGCARKKRREKDLRNMCVICLVLCFSNHKTSIL